VIPMPLREVPIEFEVDTFPAEVDRLLLDADEQIEAFWDLFKQHKVHQFVASDFRLIWGAIDYIKSNNLADGNSFCEWGCGFAVIAALASLAGFNSVGIEAEDPLIDEAKKLHNRHNVDVELWQGNFLPRGAKALAEKGRSYVCLQADPPPAYEKYDMQVDDFSVIFVYPFPGEEFYMQDIFERFARPGAILLMFLGPYQVEAYRKVSHR
jgi:hypothetical protein